MLDSISPAENYMFVRRLTNLPLVSQAVSQGLFHKQYNRVHYHYMVTELDGNKFVQNLKHS